MRRIDNLFAVALVVLATVAFNRTAPAKKAKNPKSTWPPQTSDIVHHRVLLDNENAIDAPNHRSIVVTRIWIRTTNGAQLTSGSGWYFYIADSATEDYDGLKPRVEAVEFASPPTLDPAGVSAEWSATPGLVVPPGKFLRFKQYENKSYLSVIDGYIADN